MWDHRPSDLQATSSSSSSDAELEKHPSNASSLASSLGVPTTSGIFDYCDWVWRCVLTSQEKARLSSISFTFMDFCAGLGTSLLAAEALRRQAATFKGTCVAFTESTQWKQQALSRRLSAVPQLQGSKTIIFAETQALSSTKPPVDATGKPRELPQADILFMGIVCVDISPLTSKPKSLTDSSGQSGQSWEGLISYLDLCTYENRPSILILECVANLGNKRAVDPTITGTQQACKQLRELGYVGEWRKLSPQSFYLPQSRSRVWALFHKCHGHGPHADAQAQQAQAQAHDIIRRCQLPTHEPLVDVLRRARRSAASSSSSSQQEPAKSSASSPPRKRQRTGTKWPQKHQIFMDKHELKQADVKGAGHDAFMDSTKHHFTTQQAQAMWLHIILMQKRRRLHSWQSSVLVADCGSSVGWLKVSSCLFPCVRPRMKYAVIDHGAVHIASGAEVLAVQGVQHEEMKAFNMAMESEGALHDFAGNAFTANICCAYLIAALLSLPT